MAGDWIKMRDNLWSDPRVTRICDIVEKGKATVIGGLYWLWSNADQHSVDGALPALTLKGIDRETGIRGFGKALTDPKVRWLEDGPDGVTIPRFDEHNGASAKERAEGQKRKANYRARTGKASHEQRDRSPATHGTGVPQTTGQSRDNSEAREEKRREEILTTAVDDSSIPARAQPQAGGEITPPDPSLLERIAVECARVKIAGLTTDTIERWAGQGATPSLVARAVSESAASWARTGKGEMPIGYVQTTLERILGDEAKAQTLVAKREAETRATIAEIQAAAKTAAPPPAELIEAQRKAARA